MASNQVSVHVDAPPQRCWDLVSDITNLGRWSPECHHTRWLNGDRPEVGNRFQGWNRRGPLRWSTTCVIDVAEPPHRFAFTTDLFGRRLTTWSYRFEAEAGGTRVIETRTSLARFRPFSLLQNVASGGRKNDYPAAMRTTLERIRSAAEAPA